MPGGILTKGSQACATDQRINGVSRAVPVFTRRNPRSLDSARLRLAWLGVTVGKLGFLVAGAQRVSPNLHPLHALDVVHPGDFANAGDDPLQVFQVLDVQ